MGRINCIDSTNEEEVTRFIETLKQKLGYSSENQSDIQISDSSESSTPISTFPTTQTTQTTQTNPSSTSDTSSNSIENQLVFDHRTGEFVSRAVGDIPETALLNVIGDGDLSDTSSNTDESSLVPPKKLYINGHEYVDLGLPSGLKWATCNLGSYRIEDSGTYYAWGEVKPKTPFVIANCQTYLRDKEWLKINDFIDNRGNLTLSHDAARKNWGWAWRMPTKAEIEELQSNTTASWHMVNGIDGCMLKSNINGQCIFFPAFGVKDNRTSRDNGILGMYWTSTVSEDSDIDACRFALGVNLFSLRETPRYRGLSIRPVSE